MPTSKSPDPLSELTAAAEQSSQTHTRPRARRSPPHDHVILRTPRRVNGLGIASLVLGIVATLTCWIPFVGALNIPIAGLGLIFGIIGGLMAKYGRKMDLTMPVCGQIVCAVALGIAIFTAEQAKSKLAELERKSEVKNAAAKKETEQQLDAAEQEDNRWLASLVKAPLVTGATHHVMKYEAGFVRVAWKARIFNKSITQSGRYRVTCSFRDISDQELATGTLAAVEIAAGTARVVNGETLITNEVWPSVASVKVTAAPATSYP